MSTIVAAKEKFASLTAREAERVVRLGEAAYAASLERQALFAGADRDGRPVAEAVRQGHLRHAARLLCPRSSGSDRPFICSVCDAAKASTGAGGWFTEDEAAEHVLDEHPGAARELVRMTHAVAVAAGALRRGVKHE